VCVIFTISTLFLSCTRSPESDQQAVKESVLSLLDTQLKAVNGHDVDGVIALFNSSPEFLACLDGEIYNYEEFVNAEREGFKLLKSVPTKWDTAYVRVLSSDLAIALMPFHQIQIDTCGVKTRWTGDVTFIAKRINGEWKNIYVHAVHRPDTSKL
jgi:hypothetical protein